MAIADITKPMALDETLQDTNTALGLLAKDATVSAISTALGLLGKDTSIQAVVTALGLLNKDATMVTQNSKLDTIIAKLQGIIEALGVDTSIYKAAGNKACADLTSSLLVAGNLGNVYNITDNGTTTADFVEGAGKPIHFGDNVAVVDIGEGGSHVYKFDLLSGLVDLSNYIQKSETAGLIKNDGTIDETPYTVVEASETNGNIKIDSVETPVYRNYGNNTVLTTDKTPFLSRQTLNPTGFSGYIREKLIGASYAWNQLVALTSIPSTQTINGVTFTNNGDGSVSVSTNGGSASAQARLAIANIIVPTGHKVLLRGCPNGGSTSTYCLLDNGQSTNQYDTGNGVIYQVTSGGSFVTLKIQVSAGQTIENIKYYPQLIDLTLAFGSTIADYLYNLDNNGGITKLRDMGFPIDKYTPYGYGLYSVKTSGKKIVGKNLVDSSVFSQGVLNDGSITESANWITTDFIPTFGEANITIYSYQDGTKQARCVRFSEYDASFNFIKDTANIWNKAGNFISVRTLDEKTRYIRSSHGFENIACTPAEYFATNRLMLIYGNSTTESYESYSSTTYSLGNDELRGLFKLVNNEIVADGDVKKSNGLIDKVRGRVNLGTLTYTYDSTNQRFSASVSSIGMKQAGARTLFMLCPKYECKNHDEDFDNTWDKVIYNASTLFYIHDHSYTDATVFKTALDGVYMEFDLATPTTEQSTPFADPMSMVGATTEEYIDDRTIPCPVGAERQYMGQSEDIVEIPSSPQSDGKRKLVAETSGGKTQYYFESDVSDNTQFGTRVNLATYTESNPYVTPCDGYLVVYSTGAGVALVSIRGTNATQDNNTFFNFGIFTAQTGIGQGNSIFVRKGMRLHIPSTIPLGSGSTARFYPLNG